VRSGSQATRLGYCLYSMTDFALVLVGALSLTLGIYLSVHRVRTGIFAVKETVAGPLTILVGVVLILKGFD